MICWYCYWGWSKPVVDIYNKYIHIAGEPAMHYGAAHVIWDDENFGRHHIQWCLDNYEKYKREDSNREENEAVKQSLVELLALTDDMLDPEPDNYDGKHPENFPPKIEMAHKMII